MALYEICPNCGATLDIGEMCECDHDMFNMKKVMEDVGEIIDKTEDEIRKGLNCLLYTSYFHFICNIRYNSLIDRTACQCVH